MTSLFRIRHVGGNANRGLIAQYILFGFQEIPKFAVEIDATVEQNIVFNEKSIAHSKKSPDFLLSIFLFPDKCCSRKFVINKSNM